MADNSGDTAGDAEFRAELVEMIPALRSFARGLCRGRDMAEDLAQDTVMRAWASRRNYRVGSNFRAWLFTIMRNRFYTLMRRSSRSVSCDPEMAERVLVSQPDQQTGLHMEDIAAALHQLPPEQREVLLLVGAQGVSYEEAAGVMGCALGTVKSRVARGRMALAALLHAKNEIPALETDTNKTSLPHTPPLEAANKLGNAAPR